MKQIIINSRKHGDHVVLLDDEDYDILNKWKWSIRETMGIFYAVRREGKTIIRMHRQILSLTDSKVQVDHKDRNGLNNQRNNIRVATGSQNQANRSSHNGVTSKYLGVSFCNRQKHWQVQICKDRVKKSLGRYSTEQEAALAYNEAALKIHGEFANINVL